jgi:D-arabinose 1-dehydrogenase-like Zn-dependent alcohol dehydrogenase
LDHEALHPRRHLQRPQIFKGKSGAYPHQLDWWAMLDPGDADLEPGARVVVDPNVACLRCDRCREGRANLCSAGWLLGRDRDGGLREQVVAPSANLYRLPEDLEDHLGPLIQVLTTCVHGQRLVPIFPRRHGRRASASRAVALQLAKLRAPGRGRRHAERGRSSWRELGADVRRRGSSAEDLTEESTGGGGDVLIEAAGMVATLGRAVRMARSGGACRVRHDLGDWRRLPYDLYYKGGDL